jgi:hypothetical protein
MIKEAKGLDKGAALDTGDKVLASAIGGSSSGIGLLVAFADAIPCSSFAGGALACWNHPIEVVRVEVRRPSLPDRLASPFLR